MRADSSDAVGMSRNLFFMVGSQLAGILLGFATNIVIARSLGPAGKGTYDLIFGTANLLIMFTGFSLVSGVFYYASREPLHYRRLYGILLLLALGQSLVALIALNFLQATPVTEWLLPMAEGAAVLWLVVGVMFVQQAGRFAQSLLGGKARFQSLSLINVITQVLALVLLTTLWLFGEHAPVRFIGASLLTTAVNTLLVARLVWRLPSTSDRLFLKQAVLYSLPLALGNLIQFLNYRLDIFIVNNYHGVYTVGIYTLAVSLAQLLWLVPQNLATLVLNKAAADKAGRWLPDQVMLLCRLSLWLNFGLALALYASAPLLTRLVYGERFQASVRPLFLLLPGIVLFSLTIVLSGQLAGVGKQIYTTIVAAISFFCTLALDLLLIPAWDASGAAVASTCSYALSALLTWYFFKRVHPTLQLADVLLLRRQDVTLVWALLRRLQQPKTSILHG